MTMQLSRGLGALVAAFALVLVAAAGAQAAPVKVTGSTTITPSRDAARFLETNGVSVAATGPATAAANGSFTFPIAKGFGDPQTFDGVLAHSGGLKFTKGDRSAVVRRFVAVRAGSTSVLVGQIPGLPGNCGKVRRALRQFALAHPGVRKGVRKLAQQYPKAARNAVRSLRDYCSDGRVVVVAQLTNLGKSVANGTATLTADLKLSRQAARLINKVAGANAVSAGALLGSAVSTVAPKP